MRNQAKNTSFFCKLKDTSNNSTASLLIVYIAICVVFAILSPYFLSVKNLINMATVASITGVMGAGVTVAMLIGNIDISQYAVLTLAGIVAAYGLESGLPLVVVILLAVLIGVICGAINGVLVSILKLSGIIATMGTMQIFRGLAYIITDGNTVMIMNQEFDFIGSGQVFNVIPVSVLIMIGVFILVYFLLNKTIFGRNLFAVGGNESASFLAGIKIIRVKFGAMIVSSVFAAVAGLILCSQVSAAIPSTGVGSEMVVLAAVILGGISLSGGKGRISGTIIGILILATIQNGLTLLSVPSFYQMLINGCVLIAAVTLDVVRSGALKKT